MQDKLCNDFISGVQALAMFNRLNRSEVFSHSWLYSLGTTGQSTSPGYFCTLVSLALLLLKALRNQHVDTWNMVRKRTGQMLLQWEKMDLFSNTFFPIHFQVKAYGRSRKWTVHHGAGKDCSIWGVVYSCIRTICVCTLWDVGSMGSTVSGCPCPRATPPNLSPCRWCWWWHLLISDLCHPATCPFATENLNLCDFICLSV